MILGSSRGPDLDGRRISLRAPLLPVVSSAAGTILPIDEDVLLQPRCSGKVPSLPLPPARRPVGRWSRSKEVLLPLFIIFLDGQAPPVLIPCRCCCQEVLPSALLLPLVLPQLTDEVLLLDADDVFPWDDNQPEVAVRHVHLDGLGIGAGLGGCLEELLGRGLAVFIGVCQDDVLVLG